ncbi:NADPH-dependent FMN reductase [Kutzneria sp. CA-103260]|uniref:NADPH-dependent FMN reductase n=1 Tax=Kutzneria sp. CA-103260 TaxID=2802641 RepID=UPI001BACFF7C|nr:NAD(P)H-dependent oxidoreductase [Kutzneria sp. CA-103260]QUQ68870.1 NAD(P)H-dependent oxidoreductase [Kutzneria sp. CA-103260]
MREVTILAISGSLRQGSHNTALLYAARKHAPAGMMIELYDGLGDLPPYNQDLDTTMPPPEVADIRLRIARADGLLIASPEYNYSVPGVLKNALDWASRPNPGSCLVDKPIALLGASPGNFGTARGQLALRQVLMATRSHVLGHPELLVFGAHQRRDSGGHVTDTTTLELLRQLLERFRDEIATRQALSARSQVTCA